MATTTVKVSTTTRDRLNAAATKQNLTVDRYLADLLDRDRWHRRLEAATAAMQDADDDSSYAQEVAAWDAISGDPT